MLDEKIDTWAGGICIKNGQILLIYRINREREFNQEYFVFPGGKVQDDESIEDAIVREFEEASIKVTMGELFHSNEDGEEAEYYYICEHVAGEPALSIKNDESKEMEEGKQFYSPVWVPLNDLDSLIVYPETVKHQVMNELSQE